MSVENFEGSASQERIDGLVSNIEDSLGKELLEEYEIVPATLEFLKTGTFDFNEVSFTLDLSDKERALRLENIEKALASNSTTEMGAEINRWYNVDEGKGFEVPSTEFKTPTGSRGCTVYAAFRDTLNSEIIDRS